MMDNPKKRKAVADAAIQDIGHGDYSSNPRITLSVPRDCGGQRLDQILARLLSRHSRSRLQTWIREGRVAVNGVLVFEPRQKLWGDESIELAEAA
jgi:23S rRNA pseudouridine1911/1915/1917 synthase